MTTIGSAGDPGEDSSRTRNSVSEDVSKATEAVKHEASSAAATIRKEAGSLASAAKEQVRSQAEEQKKAASQSLNSFAEAVRKAGDELRDQDQTVASRFVREAAGGLESLSRSLGERSVEDIVSSVRDFGRNNPTAFIAGSVLAGIAIGRFARSSARSEDHGLQTAGNQDFRTEGSAYGSTNLPSGGPGGTRRDTTATGSNSGLSGNRAQPGGSTRPSQGGTR